MALHSLYCADVPLRNCSLTHFELRYINLSTLPISSDSRGRAHPNPSGSRYIVAPHPDCSGWQGNKLFRSLALLHTRRALKEQSVRVLYAPPVIFYSTKTKTGTKIITSR